MIRIVTALSTIMLFLALAQTISIYYLIFEIAAAILAFWSYSIIQKPSAQATLFSICATFSATGILIGSHYSPAHISGDSTLLASPIFLISAYIIIRSYQSKNPRTAPEATTANREQSTRDRALRYLGIAALLILITGALCAFYNTSLHYAGNDEGSYIYESALTAQGDIPFRDFISRAPALIYLFAIPYMFTAATFISLKIGLLILMSITGLLAYLIIRKYQSRSFSLFGTMLLMLNPVMFISKLTINTTTLSVPLMLAAIYLLAKKTKTADVLCGATLAFLVFTREIHAFFIIALAIYFIWNKSYPRLIRICVGGIAIAVPVFWYFGSYIGFGQAIDTLLGISHVGASEPTDALSHSLAMIGLTISSLLPLALVAIFADKKPIHWKNALPALIWVGVLSLFYAAYLLKRGFLLSYGSELIPLATIAVFMCMKYEWAKSRIRYVVLMMMAALSLTLWPYGNFGAAHGADYRSRTMYDLDQLTGSGVPSDHFDAINKTIRAYADAHATSTDGRTIFAGNLFFASENNLTQFLDITRPMAYETDSTVYQIYNALPAEDIIASFKENPTLIVVADKHFQMTFLDGIKDTLADRYDLIYQDDYVYAYGLKTTPTPAPQTKK